jgi:hypothetical protein
MRKNDRKKKDNVENGGKMYRNEPKNSKKRVEHCVMCGEVLTEEGGYYCRRGLTYCCGCLDFSDAETLVRICELPKRIWFEKMGFEYVGNAKKGGLAYGK